MTGDTHVHAAREMLPVFFVCLSGSLLFLLLFLFLYPRLFKGFEEWRVPGVLHVIRFVFCVLSPIAPLAFTFSCSGDTATIILIVVNIFLLQQPLLYTSIPGM